MGHGPDFDFLGRLALRLRGNLNGGNNILRARVIHSANSPPQLVYGAKMQAEGQFVPDWECRDTLFVISSFRDGHVCAFWSPKPRKREIPHPGRDMAHQGSAQRGSGNDGARATM
jgi:hypothetical protein